MEEWMNETLIAIESISVSVGSLSIGGYKIVELPLRSSQIYKSKMTFKNIDKAEDYIEDQYPSALKVQIEDIREEIERRKVIFQKREAEKSNDLLPDYSDDFFDEFRDPLEEQALRNMETEQDNIDE